MTRLAVPGYDVVEMLGFGAAAEVWLARDSVTGLPVALKRLLAPEPTHARALRRLAAVLSAADHPHVVRVHAVCDPGGELVLVLDYAPGGSLAGLLARRGRLTAGEVVTLAVPLAQALSATGELGLVHGQITAGNVLFTDDARPLLSDFGLAQIIRDPEPGEQLLDPATDASGSAVDVYALGAVCLAALGGVDAAGPSADAHTRLAAVLRSAVVPDPDARPSAAQLAVAIFRACDPAPIDLDLPAPGDVPLELCQLPQPLVADVSPATDAADALEVDDARPRRRRAAPGRSTSHRIIWRRVATGLLVPLLLLLSVRIGLMWAGADGAGHPAGVAQRHDRARAAAATPAISSAASERAPPPSAPWMAVLRRLDARRSDAFAQGHLAALEPVYARRSPAMRRDRAALAELVMEGVKARRLHLEIRSVQVTSASATRVVLQVVDVLRPYELVGENTRVARPGRAAAPWQVTLVRERGAWRIYDVARR